MIELRAKIIFRIFERIRYSARFQVVTKPPLQACRLRRGLSYGFNTLETKILMERKGKQFHGMMTPRQMATDFAAQEGRIGSRDDDFKARIIQTAHKEFPVGDVLN